MKFSSSLTDVRAPLIFDTSVVINIYASAFGERILEAVPNKIIVSRSVEGELERAPDSRYKTHKFLQILVVGKKVAIIDMTEKERDLYDDIISSPSPPPPLGSGEAATISIAATRGLFCVIDEKNGRKRAMENMNQQEPRWSLDLFRHPEVVAALGPDDAVEALYRALSIGRMHIHADHCDQVVELIGPERAIECHSLPGYKSRRQEWERRISSGDVR